MAAANESHGLCMGSAMAHHDVIVIGASSGGVEALTTLLALLPEDLAAAIFIVVHVRPDVPSYLPAILNRAGRLPVSHAVDGEPIRQRRIYVAPPGHQTYLKGSRIGVSRGPHENLHRPAIDPLFRTAAHHYGPRVIGIILSGAMDDGSAGLRAVKQAGGVAIVQDPQDAAFPDMPANAMQTADVDYVASVVDLAPLLVSLVRSGATATALPLEVPLETQEEASRADEPLASDELGPPSIFTCPDCSGTLFEISDGGAVRYRCRVGHAYSAEAMESAQNEAAERALWSALRALEERIDLLRKMAQRAEDRGHQTVAAMFESRANDVNKDLDAIRNILISSPTLEPIVEAER